jgi:protein-S-isoprenylcysteine O-methyltransferase Ste14
MEIPIKPLLLVFAILYISIVFIGRTLIVWRKTKNFPITYGKTNSAHDFLGRIFKLLLIVNVLSTMVYLASESLYRYFISLEALEIVPVRLLGLALAYSSMLWTMIAQAQMGLSWRIGIDAGQKTEIVRRGLFKFVRHPIYFGVMTTTWSLFLIMPNVLNLIISLMTTLTLAVQARLEEEYLTQVYGDEYMSYSSQSLEFVNARRLELDIPELEGDL